MKRLIPLLLLIPVIADASCVIKADTTDNNFALGPFLDSTDGITAETGLTIEDGEVLIKQPDSTTFGEETGTSDCTHRSNGMYTCPVDSTVFDTEGIVEIIVNETGAVPVFRTCLVVAGDYYDLLDGTTAILTSRQTGNPLKTTIDAVTNQTTMSMTTGPSNDDALNNMTAYIVGGTEECERRITDYTGSGADIVLESACDNLTVATSDDIYIFNGPAGKAVQTAQADLDTITGTNGVLIDDDAITAAKTAGSFVDEMTTASAFVFQSTTIATLSTQVSFTLTAGSSDDDAYNGCAAIVEDTTTQEQKAFGGIQDYTGSSKTVTLDADPGVFTMAAGDDIDIVCLPVTVEFMNKSEVLGDGSSGDKWRGN